MNDIYRLEFKEDKIFIFIKNHVQPIILFTGVFEKQKYLDVIEHIFKYFWKDSINDFLTESLSYWSWKLTLVKRKTHYELHQISHTNRENPSFGVDNAIRLFEIQKEIVSSEGLEFKPISLLDNILISEKTLLSMSSEDLCFWRFEENEGYTGWVIAKVDYDFEKEYDMKKIHLYHIFEDIIEYLPFIVLPEGYEFFKEKGNIFFRKNDTLIS